jgi:hypothetical protein
MSSSLACGRTVESNHSACWFQFLQIPVQQFTFLGGVRVRKLCKQVNWRVWIQSHLSANTCSQEQNLESEYYSSPRLDALFPL